MEKWVNGWMNKWMERTISTIVIGPSGADPPSPMKAKKFLSKPATSPVRNIAAG